MSDRSRPLIASGNLALSRRTAVGILAQMQLLDIDAEAARQILSSVGLPPTLHDTPDFPLSFEQELALTAAMLQARKSNRHIVTELWGHADRIGVLSFGVLGLAMMSAPSVLEALKLTLTYPQLLWGHSRMLIHGDETLVELSLSAQRPASAPKDLSAREELHTYCRLIDLISMIRIIEDLLDSPVGRPRLIKLPNAKPADWTPPDDRFPDISFGAEQASLTYPAEVFQAQPVRANTLTFSMYKRTVHQMSLMLAEDIPIAEQVERWLWAYAPPLDRAGVSRALKLSERTLARRLKAEGTSFQTLLSRVQSQRAQTLLQRTQLPIADIAYRLGYSEPAAFTHAFTGWTGEAPSTWRARSSGRDSPADLTQTGPR